MPLLSPLVIRTLFIFSMPLSRCPFSLFLDAPSLSSCFPIVFFSMPLLSLSRCPFSLFLDAPSLEQEEEEEEEQQQQQQRNNINMRKPPHALQMSNPSLRRHFSNQLGHSRHDGGDYLAGGAL